MESQLRASFPEPGDKRVLKAMITGDIGKDRCGIHARMMDGKVIYTTVPVAVFVGREI